MAWFRLYSVECWVQSFGGLECWIEGVGLRVVEGAGCWFKA